MKIIVNIPAFNEAENIGKVISDIPKKIWKHTVEVMVVDDGSSDDTVKVSKQAWARYVIEHEFNKGVWWAFKTAANKFLELGADIMVNIDADGQFDTNDIPKLVEMVTSHSCDIAIGSRFSGTDADWIPWIKDKLNRLIAWVVGTLMGKKIDDLTCWFRVYNKEALLRLNLIETYTYTQETIIDAFGKWIRIKWAPISVKYFKERKSRVVKTIWSYMMRSLMIILRTVRDVKPLVFFGYPWVALTLIWIITGLVFVIWYIVTRQTTPFETWFMVSAASTSIWLLLFIFASIADMIKRQRKITEENLYLLRKMMYEKK